MKSRFLNQNVVITGGSSGIGLAIAIEFAKLGSRVFLLARNWERLQMAEKKIKNSVSNDVFVKGIECDVSQSKSVQSSIQTIAKEHGGIHTVIANAGIVHVEKFATLPVSVMKQVMEVNYWGAVYTIQSAWPYIIQSQGGHIGLVSSVAGYVGVIGYGAYSPTKFAIAGLAQSLRIEAKNSGIGLTIVYPPDTDTPQLAEENKNMLPELEKLKKHASILSPEIVAKKFVKGIESNRFEVFCNWQSKWIRRILAFWPTLAS